MGLVRHDRRQIRSSRCGNQRQGALLGTGIFAALLMLGGAGTWRVMGTRLRAVARNGLGKICAIPFALGFGVFLGCGEKCRASSLPPPEDATQTRFHARCGSPWAEYRDSWALALKNCLESHIDIDCRLTAKHDSSTKVYQVGDPPPTRAVAPIFIRGTLIHGSSTLLFPPNLQAPGRETWEFEKLFPESRRIEVRRWNSGVPAERVQECEGKTVVIEGYFDPCSEGDSKLWNGEICGIRIRRAE